MHSLHVSVTGCVQVDVIDIMGNSLDCRSSAQILQVCRGEFDIDPARLLLGSEEVKEAGVKSLVAEALLSPRLGSCVARWLIMHSIHIQAAGCVRVIGVVENPLGRRPCSGEFDIDPRRLLPGSEEVKEAGVKSLVVEALL